MTAKVQTAKPTPGSVKTLAEPRARLRFRAPFALRCGALLIDYILLALILTFSTMIARLMGGGARIAGGTAEKVGVLVTLIVAVLDLVVMAGLTGKTVGKWTTGLRLERTDGRLPGIGRAALRHLVGYPLSLLPFGLGFLIVAVSPTGRALHDLIAGTIVVRRSVAPMMAPARKPRPQGAQV
ncbi:MAG: hypothetical protein QOF72_1853 [Blastocatellia bacterium]|nr:hypothetical protein [Blastocatellia bacterium]